MIHVADTIHHHAAFSRLGAEDRDALALCFRRRSVRRGEILFREGAPGESLFLVEQGALRILGRSETQAHRSLGELAGGELLGEMACIDPAARSATALCLRDAQLLELTRDSLHALRRHRPGGAQAVYGLAARALARRLGDTYARIVERIGAAPRASSGIIPKPAPARAPQPVISKISGWFRRSAS